MFRYILTAFIILIIISAGALLAPIPDILQLSIELGALGLAAFFLLYKNNSYQKQLTDVQLVDTDQVEQENTEPGNLSEYNKTECLKKLQHFSETINSIDNLNQKSLSELQDNLKEKQIERQSACNDSKLQLESLKSDSAEILSNVNQAFSISDNLSSTAQDAFDLSKKMREDINMVTEAMEVTETQTVDLVEQSKKINKILELMNEISSKTHVLSINASIVSARAGSHGKGFEVVAREIRKLAEESGSALQEIEDVINSIQENIAVVLEKVKFAKKSNLGEVKSLESVAGALQGVVLAVEVIRTVSNSAQEIVGKHDGTYGTLITDISNIVNSDENIDHLMEEILVDFKEIPNKIKRIHSEMEEMIISTGGK